MGREGYGDGVPKPTKLYRENSNNNKNYKNPNSFKIKFSSKLVLKKDEAIFEKKILANIIMKISLCWHTHIKETTGTEQTHQNESTHTQRNYLR